MEVALIPSSTRKELAIFKRLNRFSWIIAKNTLDQVIFQTKKTKSKSVHPFESYDATDRHTDIHVKLITPLFFASGVKNCNIDGLKSIPRKSKMTILQEANKTFSLTFALILLMVNLITDKQIYSETHYNDIISKNLQFLFYIRYTCYRTEKNQTYELLCKLFISLNFTQE